MSAARCRYGRTRPIASPAPASTALLQRALRPDENRARDEELGHVDVECGLRGAERRGREVDQHRGVVDDETLLALSRPWEMPAAWSRATSPTELVELIRHLIGVASLERVDVRLGA